MLLSAAARESPLSKAQFEEIKNALAQKHPQIILKPFFTETIGDKNQQISLRTLGKTDFFTQEIDHALLSGICRIGIHSAKDLSDPLPVGLKIVALTQGLDPSDALVLRQGESFNTLPRGGRIATSSERREKAVRNLREDFSFIDVRGTIGERLAKLETGEADGVVIAEAALIRLHLTHLNRITLPGETVPFQGQLAVVAREDDTLMQEFFACLDSR